MGAKLIGAADITTNNRITIPKKVMEMLKLKSGDIILFYRKDGSIVVRSGDE